MNFDTDLIPYVKEDRWIHRCLFTGILDRKPKESFKVSDLWRHYVISTVGSRESTGRLDGQVSKKERDELFDIIVSEQREVMDSELELLEKLLDKHGLQVILFAIDDMPSSEEDGVPDIAKLIHVIPSAIVYILRVLKEKI